MDCLAKTKGRVFPHSVHAPPSGPPALRRRFRCAAVAAPPPPTPARRFLQKCMHSAIVCFGPPWIRPLSLRAVGGLGLLPALGADVNGLVLVALLVEVGMVLGVLGKMVWVVVLLITIIVLLTEPHCFLPRATDC
jgi:hypothetical protein